MAELILGGFKLAVQQYRVQRATAGFQLDREVVETVVWGSGAGEDGFELELHKVH